MLVLWSYKTLTNISNSGFFFFFLSLSQLLWRHNVSSLFDLVYNFGSFFFHFLVFWFFPFLFALYFFFSFISTTSGEGTSMCVPSVAINYVNSPIPLSILPTSSLRLSDPSSLNSLPVSLFLPRSVSLPVSWFKKKLDWLTPLYWSGWNRVTIAHPKRRQHQTPFQFLIGFVDFFSFPPHFFPLSPLISCYFLFWVLLVCLRIDGWRTCAS